MADQSTPRQASKQAQTARYVVYVDNQAKGSLDAREAADTEAKRIREAFPILNVRVADSEQNSAKTLGATHDVGIE